MAGKLALATMGACERLGAGVDRTGYALDEERIIKVGNKAANRAEVEYYQQHPEQHAWLCPVLAWAEDFSWAIYQRASEIGQHHAHELPAEIRASIPDLHHGNIGVVAGKVVVTDWGHVRMR